MHEIEQFHSLCFSSFLVFILINSQVLLIFCFFFSLNSFSAFPCPGMTAIPCACLGIFLGGLLVKKLNLSALGAVRMAMLVNLVSTACYVSFLFLGCDTGPVAGVTVAYSNE